MGLRIWNGEAQLTPLCCSASANGICYPGFVEPPWTSIASKVVEKGMEDGKKLQKETVYSIMQYVYITNLHMYPLSLYLFNVKNKRNLILEINVLKLVWNHNVKMYVSTPCRRWGPVGAHRLHEHIWNVHVKSSSYDSLCTCHIQDQKLKVK